MVCLNHLNHYEYSNNILDRNKEDHIFLAFLYRLIIKKINNEKAK